MSDDARGVYRCNLSRGMERLVDAEALVLDPQRDAPPLVFPFELTDPTSMPRLAQELVWLMQHISASMQKDEAGPYIYGLDGFSVDRQPGKKDTLFRVDADGVRTLMSEIELQARVCEVRGDVDGAPSGLYLLVVVRSPLAFSVRQGALITIKPIGRRMQVDHRGVDARCRVWARLAMHVRQMVLPRMRNADLLRTFETSMDWMRVGEADGFTCLFSAQMALEWVRSHYASKHGAAWGRLVVPGLRDVLELDDALCLSPVTPEFVAQCRQYDADVDRETKRSMEVRLGLHGDGKKKQTPRKRKTRQRRGQAQLDEDGEEEDEAAEEEAAYVAVVRPPEGLELDDGRLGVPACKIHLELLCATPLEGQLSLVDFRRQMSTFPESVMLELLQGSLNLSEELMASVALKMNEQSQDALVGIAEMRDIVMDGGRLAGQHVQMLAMHDSVWGAQAMSMVCELEGAERRLGLMRDLLRMGFALAHTRAIGSGGYTNGRVAAYGRFFTLNGGEDSRAECRRSYASSRGGAEEPVSASLTHHAWRYATEQIHACNQRAWHLRPDNMHLFFQVMVSDVQLALNFYGSVVDGAHNGIGATLVIVDGNRNYRRRFYDRETNGRADGVVLDKSNSTGADTALCDYVMAVKIDEYCAEVSPGEVFTELKRVTELSLVQATCDIWEGLPGHMTLRHSVTETMGRKYSTELKANGDQQSENCMTAIAWLIPRNTRTTACNSFQTTRENDGKERILVEYRQVTDGYLVLCANKVRGAARERYHTMLAVSRSVASSADGMSLASRMDDAEEEREATVERRHRAETDGRVDPMVNGGGAKLEGLGRGLFFGGMGVALFAGFMQWTGMLGQIREPRTTAALLRTFTAHFELCHDLMNPDMACAGNRARFLEVSKARGVAVSLLGISMRETIEAGRRGESQQMAVERTCAAFRVEGASAATAWIMADTLEHMLRLDFFLLMQMLCQMLGVPYVDADALLEWMETGVASEACAEAERFLERRAIVAPSAVDAQWGLGGAHLTPIDQCLYITDEHLLITRLDTPTTPEVRSQFCERVSKRLWSDFSGQLRAHANLNEKEKGDQVVRAMIEHCVDRQFAWPSVLGRPAHFGLGRILLSRGEEDEDEEVPLAVAPLRMVLMETTAAQLCVDVRWLLLVNALSEGCLSQSSRFSIVGRLVQRFYQHCVPAELVSAEDLFIGLPTQWTGAGFVWPPVLPTRRRMLRRPGPDVGTDAPCRSGLIEDMGAAAPRMELAKLLSLDSERALPTECVHYEFPPRVWTPVLLEDEGGAPAALMWRDGRFWLKSPRRRGETDITATADGGGRAYLSGRVTRAVRPLPHFYRPGILVEVVPGERWGRVAGFEAGRYTVVCGEGHAPLFWTAYEVEDRLVLPDAHVRFDAVMALPANVRLQSDDGRGECATSHHEADEDARLLAEGELEALQVEDVPDGRVAVRMRRGRARVRGSEALFGASHGGKACLESETRAAHRFYVPVEAIRDVAPRGTAFAHDAWTRVVMRVAT